MSRNNPGWPTHKKKAKQKRKRKLRKTNTEGLRKANAM